MPEWALWTWTLTSLCSPLAQTSGQLPRDSCALRAPSDTSLQSLSRQKPRRLPFHLWRCFLRSCTGAQLPHASSASLAVELLLSCAASTRSFCGAPQPSSRCYSGTLAFPSAAGVIAQHRPLARCRGYGYCSCSHFRYSASHRDTTSCSIRPKL